MRFTILIAAVALCGVSFWFLNEAKNPGTRNNTSSNPDNRTSGHGNKSGDDPDKNLNGINNNSTDNSNGSGASTEGDNSPTSPKNIKAILEDCKKSIAFKDGEKIQRSIRAIKQYPKIFLPYLIEMAKNDASDLNRSFSVRMLGDMKNAECKEVFESLLLSDTSLDVRSNSAWALGELGAPDTAELLSKVMKDDPVDSVRKSAEEALRKIK